jgi:hypothetical protein
MEETACAENNISFDASVSEIPKAEKDAGTERVGCGRQACV